MIKTAISLLLGDLKAVLLVAGALFIDFRARLLTRYEIKKEQKIKDAEHNKEITNNADEALRRADGDNRPVDERLREYNALRGRK